MKSELGAGARLPMLGSAAVCAVAAMALAVAMGIGRFAFTPLLPLMVRDGSLAESAGPWLAASNYLGYLAGAMTASRLGLPALTLMRASLAGIVVATGAMGAFDGLAAWIVLRCIAGVLSAWTLISTSTWSLQHLAQAGRSELSGLVYAGVGLGIALAGLFCLAAARPGVSASRLWLELGAVAAPLVCVASLCVGRSSPTCAFAGATPPSGREPGATTGLVVCYGVLGFGYILPATFLPALAREVVDDPQLFGLAWPVFGVGAALSTIATAWCFGFANRLCAWAVSHLLMAAGVILPSLWLGAMAIAIAAILVGSTFMVVTMVGLQEARARKPDNPTPLLAQMTAAFAIGQLAGPLACGIIGQLQVGHRAALGYVLQIGACALAGSAAYLWIQSHRSSGN